MIRNILFGYKVLNGQKNESLLQSVIQVIITGIYLHKNLLFFRTL